MKALTKRAFCYTGSNAKTYNYEEVRCPRYRLFDDTGMDGSARACQ